MLVVSPDMKRWAGRLLMSCARSLVEDVEESAEWLNAEVDWTFIITSRSTPLDWAEDACRVRAEGERRLAAAVKELENRTNDLAMVFVPIVEASDGAPADNLDAWIDTIRAHRRVMRQRLEALGVI